MKKKIIGLISMMLLITPVLMVTADENNNMIVNHPPDAPVIVSGQEIGVAKEEYEYTIYAFDRDRDDVSFNINWDEEEKDTNILDIDEDEAWLGPYKSGEQVTFNHVWSKKGEYTVTIKAKDSHGFTSKETKFKVSISKNKIVDITTHKGGADKGIILVEGAQVEGIPGELYIGSLREVDFQLNDVNIFLVTSLPFFFGTTFLEFTDNIHLTIDSFWGMTDSTYEENAMIVGFGRNIEWEW